MKPSLQCWLLYLADPHSQLRTLPPMPLSSDELPALISAAAAHAVLPTVAHNMQRFKCDKRLAEVLRRPDLPAAWQRFTATATPRLLRLVAMSLFLREKGSAATAAFAKAGIPALIVKGPLFAQRLYNPFTLRPFIDIDLLIPQSAWPQVPEIMATLDFHPHDSAMKYDKGYGEQGFVHRAFPGCSLEVHWNLVNSPTLRRGISVTLDDLTISPEITPASLLLIATVHAAASHSFDKLQHLVDIVQIARGTAGPINAEELRSVSARCGANLALATGLSLAARAFNEDRCITLLDQLRLRPPFLARRLLTPALVLRGQLPGRRRDSWRRQIFRHLLKQNRLHN